MSQKTYLMILKGGIFLAFLSVFFVFKTFLFPYITSKQIYFNILIEILFVFWLAFIVKFPDYKPRKNYITFGLIAFFSIITISCFTGVDFNLSFWGDIERMLGVFHLLHFLFFYLMIITVMRTWKDWRMLFVVALSAGTLVGLYGIGQKFGIISSPMSANRIIATIGNSAYVGAYAIFNIFFALLLFFKEKNWGFKSVYLLAMVISFFALIFSGTRGAYIGFFVGLVFIGVILTLFNASKKIKFTSISLLAISIIFVVLIFAFKDTDAISKNIYLSRLTHMSIQDATTQTRLLSWKAAYQDFHNHPFLGTGWGNYAVTFDKFFNPIFLSYTAGETYFDRAHNNIVDITSTTGALGILSYLSIFVFVGYYLVAGFRRKTISIEDFSVISALIIAYFIQNLLVFDSLVTYLSLMVILGYLMWLSSAANPLMLEDKAVTNGNKQKRQSDLPGSERGNLEFYALVLAGIFSAVIIYQYNIKVISMLNLTIEGQQYASQGDILNTYSSYQKADSLDTVLNRDSNNTFVRVIAGNLDKLGQLNKDKAQEIIDFAIRVGEKNLRYNPHDSLQQMQQAQLYDSLSRFYYQDKEKFSFYNKKAEDAISKSIEASPGRVPVYFNQAQIYLTTGQKEKAIASLKYAQSLNPKFIESSCQLARLYFYFNNDKDGYATMDSCLSGGGSSNLQPIGFVNQMINHYADKKDWDRLLVLVAKTTELDPKNAKNFVNLAKLNEQLGNFDAAITAANQAGEIDPSLKQSAADYVKTLEEKKLLGK
jgi:O-antigen ligase/tetratricopeptide (TPR) repeat protein